MRFTPDARVPDFVLRAQRGDEDAFAGLVDCYRDRLRALARGTEEILQRRLEPDDLVQEMLCAIWRGLPDATFPSRGAFEGWLFRVGRHRLMDLVRESASEKRGDRARREEVLGGEIEELAEDVSPPSRLARRRDDQEGLRKILSRLPDAYRDVLWEVRVQGRTTGEVADRLGLTRAAVRKRLERALALCRGVVDGSSFAGWRSPLPPPR